ncbi:hypothetical protein [Chitinophaga sp. YR573]|uniref:hypothetical protein n=1 Tax=Chitinophaga sp. YR573 TaxID=1881040 RepID=UPI00115F9D40|nr:hypothetical protein [Chitinophaga sp. YR573]
MLEDVLLMDMGSSVMTAPVFTGKLATYLDDNPLNRYCRQGMIHSHNNMPVFFSDTDKKDIHINAPNHNYYLSIIVNNSYDIIGKMSVFATQKTTSNSTLNYLGNNGVHSTKVMSDTNSEEEIIGIYECNIVHHESQIDEDFRSRCFELTREPVLPSLPTAPKPRKAKALKKLQLFPEGNIAEKKPKSKTRAPKKVVSKAAKDISKGKKENSHLFTTYRQNDKK